jgi:hypothetical protein
MISSSLRPAVTGDFAFCRRLYFEEMAWIIDTLKLDIAKQRENFSVQWRLAEVRIITVAAENVAGCRQLQQRTPFFSSNFI